MDLRPKQTSFGPAVRFLRQRPLCFSLFSRSASPRSDLRPSLSWTRPWSHRRLSSSPTARYGPPDAHRPPSRQRRTEVQMKAAGQIESEGSKGCGGRLRCPSMPTSLALKRRGGRPSTPKGVARFARLTATRHDAEGAAMSADWTSGRASGVDCGVDGAMDRAFTPVLAWRCGCGRPPAADHAPSRSKNGSFVNGRGRLPGDLDRRGTGTGADAGWRQCGDEVDAGDGKVGGDGSGSKCGDASSRSQVGKTAQERGREQ